MAQGLEIRGLGSWAAGFDSTGNPAGVTGERSEGGIFREMLFQALEEVNAMQAEADRLSEKLVTGEIQDVAQVMIASQKAELSLQLAIQVRNKILEAYQEIMRIQV